MKQYDVIVIGGGPTGSTAATLLARQGKSVLVLEKTKMPREHVGESLIPHTYHSLKNVGVLDELKKISPRKPGVSFVEADGRKQSLWCFKNVLKDESYLSFHVKRSMFDELLLNNSRKNGAEVLEETMVKNVILDRPDGIVEVHAENKSGERLQYTTKFLLDASGLSTFLASKMGTKKPVEALDRVAMFTHWSNCDFDIQLKQGVIRIVYLGGKEKLGWIWIIPISKDNLSIGVVLNNSFVKKEKERLSAAGKDWLHELYMSELGSAPVVQQLLKNAEVCHKVQIVGNYSYGCEKKLGSNYALLGDAGAFLDPIFSSGIYVGMHSSELVVDALIHKFETGDQSKLEAAYVKINGAVKLLEKFIRLFYSPDILNLAHMGDTDKMLNYEQSEKIYSIFHLLLAGDFFENYEKYSEFIDLMNDKKMIQKFQHLIEHSEDRSEEATCGEDFEEMYGEMSEELVFHMDDLK